MTANDVDEWLGYVAATKISWGQAVRASPTFNSGENYVTPTDASTDLPLGVCMVTASPRGQPCPIAVSGVVEVICESTTGTAGFEVVCVATEGRVRVAGAPAVTGATNMPLRLGILAENFSSNSAGDKVKVILSPGRR